MRKSLLTLLLFYSFSTLAQTQFDRILTIPVNEGSDSLRNPWAGGINFPLISPIDLNDDGKEDIFIFDHQNDRIITFLNNGATIADHAWDYAPEYIHQFPNVNEWAFLYDYDCDGKPDFFTLSKSFQCSAGIAVYRNVTTGSTLQWTIVDSCLKETFAASHPNIYANAISLPNFNDIDGDGDMDILGYNSLPDGRILFHKNYSVEDYSVCDSLKFKLETLCYGAFQLCIALGGNRVCTFHSPCRIKSPNDNADRDSQDYSEVDYNPIHTEDVQSEAARRDDTISSIFSLDLDGDGNLELLFGDISSPNSLMVHNGGIDMDSQDTLYPSTNTSALFDGFHRHAFMDTDNDGLKDLIVSAYEHENKSAMWLYKNSGTNNAPVFNLEETNFLQGNMIDVGEDACPVFFDYDNDNLSDLVISKAIFDTTNGAYKTGLFLYKNTGTPSDPSFDLITNDFAGLGGAAYTSPTYPAFGDLDGDGDKDMLIGTQDGRFHYYENTGGIPPNFIGPTPFYMGIDVSSFATPQLYDLNHDGKLDIICGSQHGFVFYFKNRGTLFVPNFDNVADTLGCIALLGTSGIGGYTVPFFYDSLGVTNLLVAHEDGNIEQYDQIDGNLTGCFNHKGSLYSKPESTRIKFNITVSGADLNGDTLTDIIIGQSTGGAEIRYMHGLHSSVPDISEIKPSFEIFPNPVNNEMSIHFYHLDNHSSVLRVFNSIGELVTEKTINDEITDLKTASWSAGIYLVQVASGKNSVSRKIIVKH